MLVLHREVTEKQSSAATSTASTSPRSSASGEPIYTLDDTGRASVRQTPSRHDIDNATDHNIEDIAHQAAVETAEAEGGSPTGLHPIQEGGEELSTHSSYSPVRVQATFRKAAFQSSGNLK
jgi:hypothetical protein